MKYCQNCRRLYKYGLEECVHDGTPLTDIQEAFSTHSKPDPFTSILDLPHIEEAVQPHDDWATWQAHHAQRIPSRFQHEEPLRECKPEQRQRLTSMGTVLGAVGFLLLALTAMPAQAADATTRLGSATVEATTPTTSSSEMVIVTKSGTVVQKMSSMSPQERWFSQRVPTAKSLTIAVNNKVARIYSGGPGKFSTPTAR